MIDIQRQLKGLPSVELETVKAEDYIFKERVWVIDALFTFASLSPEEECRQQVKVIDALTALCRLQEGKCSRRLKPSTLNIKLERDLTPPSTPQARRLSDSLPIECKPTQCIFCLSEEGLSAEKRLWTFSSCGDLKKHLHRKHLRHHPEGHPIACPHPKCQVDLTGTVHLQSHVELVHKTLT